MTPDQLRAALDDRTAEPGRRWLDDSLAAVAADPSAVHTLFPQAGRRCGRGPLGDSGPYGWTVDDAARALLLTALPLRGDALLHRTDTLYRTGDAEERRAVLRALPLLPLGGEALPLVRDALRTNDTRLVAAALGDYATAYLDPDGYRQGVLKCVFTGIPLAVLPGLPARADAELARMLTAFAAERTAAGRPVPADIGPAVEACSRSTAP
ncbi:EboA domain-containing protein [Peterkaempfera sp. SMS 1(5)a]|uniref:EboA domain-containing protein n=1 Tax=Peterkaempfera podocarpi TaxID=3232308 RepID=UPI00366EFC73